MNLAHVRLDRGRAREALAPARRAHDLASARGAESGVDVLIARFALGRAELAADDAAGEQGLLSALEQAQTRTDIHAEAHLAAQALAEWAFKNRRWRSAQAASVAAGQHTAGAPTGEAFGRADAQMGEGAALLFLRKDRDALAKFTEAMEAFRPFADIPSEDGGMTVAQAYLARAIAWRAALSARMRSSGERVPSWENENGYVEGAPAPLSPPCDVRIVPQPLPQYPRAALEDSRVGAVVVRFRVANGEIAGREVAAAVPSAGGFAEAVTRVMDRWTVERKPESPPNCRMDMTLYQPVVFLFP
jgi:hypothetical protein